MAPRGRPVRASANRTPASSNAATPNSSRPPTNRVSKRSTRASIKAEIPDSDDLGDLLSSDPVAAKGSSFQGVVVPSPSAAHPRTGRHDRSTESTAPSSIADSADSPVYETPATSAAQTPVAAGQSSAKSAKPKIGATARSQQLKASAFALGGTRSSSRKRKAVKHTTQADDGDDEEELAHETRQEANDAKFAALLQAQEYQVVVSASDSEQDILPRLKKRRLLAPKPAPAPVIADSNDDKDAEDAEDTEEDIDDGDNDKDDDNNDDGEYDDGDSDVPATRTSKNRSSKKQTRLSIRTIASKAKHGSLAATNSDSSELSEPPSGSEQSAFEDDAADGTSRGSTPSSADSTNQQPTAPVTMQEMRQRQLREKHEARARKERRKLEKAHPEIITMWKDLADIPPIKPVARPQPEGINRDLKSFQLEGVDWMRKQEQTQWKGGLLGDEMGMGKTIQAVSLIMSDYPAKQPTLVVVPPVALMQWQAEISDYTSGKLKVLVYHVSANPKCKLLTVKDLKKYDVIMVSYSGLESMYRKENKGWNRNDGIVKEDSILHSLTYHRLILDEAHSIKSRTASVAKACFALKGKYKWCLSGTPVQNRIGEFFSLLRFLEVQPFACYFCKQCSCKELHWVHDKQNMCKSCEHSGFSHVSVFNQEVLNPITQGENAGLRQKGLDKLRLITDRIMLRRLKRNHTSSMELPPKDVIIHNEFFGEIERDFSQSIMSNSTRKFDTYVAQGVMLNNYANIFGLIMQMRQVANHPDLILRKNAEGGQNVLVCCICDEPAEEAIRSKCRHEFCRQCAKNYVQSFSGGSAREDADCPQCHIPLVIDWDQPEIEQDEENVKKSSIINRIKMEEWTSSTKIEQLVYDLFLLRSTKQTQKSIVFSQFTSMLQLVQWRLQKSGFSTVMLDGSMSPSQRQKSIDHFMKNIDVEVFLVSLKAGGVALNLTEASRVFIVDPWWNPAAEWQSADRCHRIGQRRPCVITRLCIEDSVESRMVLLQEKKANMINGTVNNDQVALDKLTPEDMQFLFRGS